MTNHVTQTLEQMDARESERDFLTQHLVDDITQLLAALRDRVLHGQEFVLHGLHTYMDWLPRALDINGVQYEHKPGRRKRTGSLVFHLHGWVIEMYNIHVQGDTFNHQSHPNMRGDTTDYLGNMVVMRLRRISVNFVRQEPELCVQWLAADIATSDRGMTRQQWNHSGWVFPQPVFREMRGDHQAVRDWLMLANQSLTN